MTGKNRRITDPLWLAVACTAPLFSVSFLRINFSFYHAEFHLPFAGVFMAMIMAIGIRGLFSGSSRIEWDFLKKNYGKLAVLIVLFLLWHLISLTRSTDKALGMKSFFRIFSGVICLGSIILFLPRDRAFLKRFFIVFSWAMALLLTYLIYVYGFIFNLTYLSSDLDFNRILLSENRVGKNQLAYFVAQVFPFAYFIFFDLRQRVIAFFPLLVMSISIIYAASRGSWISLTLAFLALLIFALCNRKFFSSPGHYRFLILLISVFSIAFLFLALYVPLSEISTRFVSIFHPSAATMMLGRYSYESRGTVLLQAWRGFLTSPWAGVGLGNATNYTDGLVHNDYVCVLLEMGIVGFLLFFGILWEVIHKLWQYLISFRRSDFKWSYWAIPCSLMIHLEISFFYDYYLAAFYWMFIGLYLVVIEADQIACEGKKG